MVKLLIDANENDPFFYLHGHENVIPGIEKAVAGMKIGESKTFTVQPEDGYGRIRSGWHHAPFPARNFPKTSPSKTGLSWKCATKTIKSSTPTVESTTKTMVKLNFNHPLAGKELHFNVTRP